MSRNTDPKLHIDSSEPSFEDDLLDEEFEHDPAGSPVAFDSVTGFDDDLLLVTPSTREAFLSRYPIIADRIEHRRTIAYLLAGDFRDDLDDSLLLAKAVLNAINERTLRNAERYLRGFRRDVAPLRWAEAVPPDDAGRGKARSVVDHGLDDDLVRLVDRDLRNPRAVLVSFVTGFPPKRRKLVGEEPIPELRFLVEGLNRVPEEAYRRIREGADAALDNLPRLTPRQTERVLPILARVRADPVVRYRPYRRTRRIGAVGASYLGLPRAVREIVSKQVAALDVRQCQIALAANLWDCPELARRLGDPNYSFWSDAIRRIGADDRDPEEVKAAIKKAVYAGCFGRTHARVRSVLVADLSDPAPAHLFLGLPEVAQLFDRRDAALAEVASGPVLDAFGHTLDAQNWYGLKPKAAARSVLACRMQSFEVAVMAEAARYCFDNGVPIVGWLHDGLYIEGQDRDETANHVERIRRIVASRATELIGSPLYLDHRPSDRRGRPRQSSLGRAA